MRVQVRVRPGARRDEVGGCWDGPRGPALLVAVRARAVEGQANEAVVAALASAFALRRGEVAITAGHRGRDKIVELAGEGDTLRPRLAELLVG
ncbi:MAG TPA: DUF167 domain-containing protein [Pseudonocardia sp.]|uniref:DUF167 domain-containing protein n=1 Tax=Pseudonocardia sp. TaxID=60912 RepID=UPI002CAE2ED8|nr:DUF167 domain-containing protein [Pseudonocardia sp.]HTF49678.1 DUF167 domain-containing protein [Pseudonocardia sp.]